MRGFLIALVLLTGCSSLRATGFNINAFGMPVDGRNVHAQVSNPALDDREDPTEAGPIPWPIWVIIAVAAGFGLYAGAGA